MTVFLLLFAVMVMAPAFAIGVFYGRWFERGQDAGLAPHQALARLGDH